MGVSEKNLAIINSIKATGLDSCKALQDLLDMAKEISSDQGDNDLGYALKLTAFIRRKIPELPFTEDLNKLYWDVLKFEGPYRFESFLLYMEKNRPAEEKFYQPRIKPLRQVAQGIQDLADDLLDELFINMPSRVGKTQIVKFAFLWWGSRDSELSNLYTAYSDKITKAFYTGLIELMTDPTYTYRELFPGNKIAGKNGDDLTIDLVRSKTYPTFTCRSIYGTLNGSCDCNGLAVADDLFSGIEEAISTDRQETVWQKFDNNFMKRLKRKAKLINMGTRWAPKDCQGRRRHLLETNKAFAKRRYRIISIPALDENDESNFDYPFDLGYSTEDYRMMRASFEENNDMASWYAQDQQDPIDRQGALFKTEDMRFFDPAEMPEGDPDRIFMAVDIAYGGGDYVAAPICYQYGDRFFIPDVIFDDRDKSFTRPRIVNKIIQHKIQAAQLEGTLTNTDFYDWIDDKLRKSHCRINLTLKPASNKVKKEYRIKDKAPEIREMYFLKPDFRDKEYQQFMSNVFSFKWDGKNKHDDAPDSLAQLCDMITSSYAICEAFARPF